MSTSSRFLVLPGNDNGSVRLHRRLQSLKNAISNREAEVEFINMLLSTSNMDTINYNKLEKNENKHKRNIGRMRAKVSKVKRATGSKKTKYNPKLFRFLPQVTKSLNRNTVNDYAYFPLGTRRSPNRRTVNIALSNSARKVQRPIGSLPMVVKNVYQFGGVSKYGLRGASDGYKKNMNLKRKRSRPSVFGGVDLYY
jgi:hypothetical protein